MAGTDEKAAVVAKYRATPRFKQALEIIAPGPPRRAECQHDLAQSFIRIENAARIDKTMVSPSERRKLLQKLAKTLRVAIKLAVRARPWDYSRVEDLKGYLNEIERAAYDVRKAARKFSNTRLYAVRQAYLLLKKYGKRPTRYRNGCWHELARVLFGNEQADLFDYIEDYESTNWFSNQEI